MAADALLWRFDPGHAHADEWFVASLSNRREMASSAEGYARCDRDCRLERGGIHCSYRGVSFGGFSAAKDNDFQIGPDLLKQDFDFAGILAENAEACR